MALCAWHSVHSVGWLLTSPMLALCSSWLYFTVEWIRGVNTKLYHAGNPLAWCHYVQTQFQWDIWIDGWYIHRFCSAITEFHFRFLFSLCTPCFKKTSTHIIGYKLRNSCPILIIFDIKIPHIIWHRKTAWLSTSPN